MSDFESKSQEFNTMSSNFVSGGSVDESKLRSKKLGEQIIKLQSEINDLLSKSHYLEGDFRKICAQRNERLQSFFNKVRPMVDRLYKTLSGDATASAALYLENATDPSQGGIMFAPTPANKKFVMNAANLSGGEKSIAALALYFSMNEVLQTPVLLVDEIDAHLDKKNLVIIYYFMRKLGESRQIIFISHRPGSFDSSDSLLGVTIDFSHGKTSRCFSMDVKAFNKKRIESEAEAIG